MSSIELRVDLSCTARPVLFTARSIAPLLICQMWARARYFINNFHIYIVFGWSDATRYTPAASIYRGSDDSATRKSFRCDPRPRCIYYSIHYTHNICSRYMWFVCWFKLIYFARASCLPGLLILLNIGEHENDWLVRLQQYYMVTQTQMCRFLYIRPASF